MSVIELGDVSSAPPGPERREAGPEFDPRSWRRIAAVAVVLVCLLALAASGRPGTPMVHEVWSIHPTADYAMSVRPDGVFVHQRTMGAAEVVAYELTSGKVRWRRPVEGVPLYLTDGEEAGLLLIRADEKVRQITFEDGGMGVVAYGGHTTALDARTGDRLWQQPGEVMNATRDTLLFAERQSDGKVSSLRLVRPRDGTVVWRRELSGVEQVMVPSLPDRIVTADSAGTITVLRYSDGTEVHERRLPWSTSRPGLGIDTYVAELNGLLVIIQNDPRKSEISTYRLDSLEQLWRTQKGPYAYAQDCGPVLCLAETTAITGVDALTGRQLWRLPGFSGVTQVAEDRLLASVPGPEPGRQVVLEPDTGRQIGPGGTGWALTTGADAESVIVLRRIIEEHRAYSTISHLDLETGRSLRIGAIDGVDGHQCTPAGRHMVCDQGGRLVVTAVG